MKLISVINHDDDRMRVLFITVTAFLIPAVVCLLTMSTSIHGAHFCIPNEAAKHRGVYSIILLCYLSSLTLFTSPQFLELDSSFIIIFILLGPFIAEFLMQWVLIILPCLGHLLSLLKCYFQKLYFNFLFLNCHS